MSILRAGLVIGAVAAVLIAGLGLQSWRLHNAQQLTIQQAKTLSVQETALTEKNSQLKSVAEQAEHNNQEQARLRALANENQAALSARQKTIERLKRENAELKRWADTPLPADIVRLRQRPVLTGGHAYREWLSQSNAVPVSGSQPTDQRRTQ